MLAPWIRDSRTIESEIRRRGGKATITSKDLRSLLLLLVAGTVLIYVIVDYSIHRSTSKTTPTAAAATVATVAAKNEVGISSTGAPAVLPATTIQTAIPTAIPTATINPRLLIRYEEDGQCLIKGNINSKGERIYHLPGSSSYAATKIETNKGERWFCTEAEAIAAGWHAPAQ